MSERRDIIMRRDGQHLTAVNDAEAHALMDYPEGKDLWVSIRRKRSNAHHSLYWAMLERVISSGATRYHSAADLHKALKYEMGFVKPVRKLSGDIVYEPDSISFDRMDQTEFNSFFETAMRLMGEYFGINPDDMKG